MGVSVDALGHTDKEDGDVFAVGVGPIVVGQYDFKQVSRIPFRSAREYGLCVRGRHFAVDEDLVVGRVQIITSGVQEIQRDGFAAGVVSHHRRIACECNTDTVPHIRGPLVDLNDANGIAPFSDEQGACSARNEQGRDQHNHRRSTSICHAITTTRAQQWSCPP